MAIRERIKLRDIATYWGIEINLQMILARLQDTLHIASPLTVHIVGTAQTLAIEVNVCIGIQALEDDFLIFCIQLCFCRSNISLIHPVFLIYPLHTTLIESIERIIDDVGTHQVEM